MAINNGFTDSVNGLLKPGYTSPSLGVGGSTTGAVALPSKPPTPGAYSSPIPGFQAGNTSINPNPYQSPTSLTSSASYGPQPVTGLANSSGTSGGGAGGTNMYGMTSASPNWYQLQNGESTQNYAGRTGFMGSSGGSTASNTPPPTTQPSGAMQGALGGLTSDQIAAANNTATNPTNTGNGLVPPPNPQSNAYQNTGAPGFSPTVGALASTASQSSPQYQAALQQYGTANQGLMDLRSQFAQQNANIGGGRTNLAEAGGEQGLLQNLEAGKESALTGEMNASIVAAQAATGQQNTQQQGLGTAAGYEAPQAANVFGTYNPITGQYSGYGGAGGTFAAGQASGNFSAGQNFQQTIAPAYQNAQGILNGTANDPGLSSFLKTNPDLNPTDVNFGNQIKAWAEGKQTSDARYTKLGQYLNEFLQTLTPIVGSQGVSNYKTQLVQNMVDPSAKNTSIQDQLNNIWNIASGKVGSTYQTGQSNYSPSGSSGSNLTIPGTSGSYSQGSDGTWKYTP